MKNLLAFMFAALLQNGCAASPVASDVYNIPYHGKSTFDGSQYIRVSRMVCSNSVMFELYQDSEQSKKGVVLLKAGSKSVANIDGRESLLIKLDDKVYSFESIDRTTEHETLSIGHGVTMPFSHKTYVLTDSFVREVASSNIFLAKVNLLNKSYVDGKCSNMTLAEAMEQQNGSGVEITQNIVDEWNKVSAIAGFQSFVNMMDAMSGHNK